MITKEQLDKLIELAYNHADDDTNELISSELYAYRDELLTDQKKAQGWCGTITDKKPDFDQPELPLETNSPIFNAIKSTSPDLIDRAEDITNDCYAAAYYDDDFLKAVQNIITRQSKLIEDLVRVVS